MEIDQSCNKEMEKMDQTPKKKIITPLLILNAILLATGYCGGPMLLRLYFLRGGKQIWLSSWTLTGGWPAILIPLLITYLRRRHNEGSTAQVFFMEGQLFYAATVIGVLTGLDEYLYAYGVARLPISTVYLIASSKLAFIAAFGLLLVKQKFTPYSTNAVVLLTIGTGVLALNTSIDQPKGESRRGYYLGFFMMAVSTVLYGLLLPLVELTYKKAKQAITYTLVLEIQLVMCFFGTLFSTIGMIINKDFKAISKEARDFEHGEATYYVELVCMAIIFQFYYLGAIGVIFTASSLLAAIITSVLLPVVEILAVICFGEKFHAAKGVSLVLSLWGFASYYYGELKHSKDKEKGESETQVPEEEMPQSISISSA